MRGRTALLGALALGTLVGCASAPLHRDHPEPDPRIKGEITPDKVERALRMRTMRRLEYLNANKERFQREIIRTRIRGENYYFRFYDWFPGDWEDVKVKVTTRPTTKPVVVTYEGAVEYPRVRYETLYASNANRIKTTDQFVRDEGTVRERYEFVGTAWLLRDSYFNVDRTSIYRDDAWVPVGQRLRRVEEKQPEFFLEKITNLFRGRR